MSLAYYIAVLISERYVLFFHSAVAWFYFENEKNKKALLLLTGLCVLVVIGGFEPPTPAL